jgi:hypothetical protein
MLGPTKHLLGKAWKEESKNRSDNRSFESLILRRVLLIGKFNTRLSLLVRGWYFRGGGGGGGVGKQMEGVLWEGRRGCPRV